MNYPTPGPGQELVKALTKIEHDRISREPRTKTALFVLDVGAADTLAGMGVIKRGTPAELIAELQAELDGTEASPAVVQQTLQGDAPKFEGDGAVNFADVADASRNDGTEPLIDPAKPVFDAQATLGALADAQAALEAQGQELQAARAQADEVTDLKAALAERDDALSVARADLQTRSDQLQAAQERIVQLVNGDAAGPSDDAAGDGGAAGTSTDATDAAKGAAKTPATKTTAKKTATTKAK